jgi:hypothetical protein
MGGPRRETTKMTPAPKEQVSADEYEFEDLYDDADDYDEFRDDEGFDLDEGTERGFTEGDFAGDDFEDRPQEADDSDAE